MRFNCTLNEVTSAIAEWYAGGKPDEYGNNSTGQRLGQFVCYKLNNNPPWQPWPELFFERVPSVAESLIYAEFNI